METTVLELQFVSVAGRRFSLTINDPKENLTEEAVKTAMEQIVAINAFRTTTGDVAAAAGARIVTRSVNRIYEEA